MQNHYSPTAAAALVGISVSSLRNWCAQFGDHLSASAHPPPGKERQLSAADVAVLQRVRDLRAQGMTTEAIRAALQQEDLTTLQPVVDVAPTPPAQAATEQPQAHAEALQIVAAMNERQQAIEQRIAAVETATAQRMTWFAYGVLVGVALVAVAAGLVWLGLWLAR